MNEKQYFSRSHAVHERNRKMRKVSLFMAFVLLLGCILTSCGSGRSYKAFEVDPDYVPEEDPDSTVTVQNFDGEMVTLSTDIDSVVCFSPEAARAIAGIGSAKVVTAVDEETSAAISALNVITEDDIESQDADLIFIKESYNPEELLSGDTPYIKVPDELTIQDVITLTRIVEKVLMSSRDSLADAIENQMNAATTATSEYVNKYKVFIDLGSLKTVGSGTYISEILNICGCESVFADREGYFEATAEEVTAADPVFFFTVSDPKSVVKTYSFRTLNAVKNNMIYQIDPAPYAYADYRIADAINEIFTIINEYRLSQGD